MILVCDWSIMIATEYHSNKKKMEFFSCSICRRKWLWWKVLISFFVSLLVLFGTWDDVDHIIIINKYFCIIHVWILFSTVCLQSCLTVDMGSQFINYEYFELFKLSELLIIFLLLLKNSCYLHFFFILTMNIYLLFCLFACLKRAQSFRDIVNRNGI